MQKQYRYKRENNADTFYKGHRHCNVSEKKSAPTRDLKDKENAAALVFKL